MIVSIGKKLIIKVIFTDNKLKCWKFLFDMNELRLDEILINIEEQYNLK